MSSVPDIREYEALVRRLKTLSIAQTTFLKSLLFGKLEQAKLLVSKTLDLLGNAGSKEIVEMREALMALYLHDIEVDVTSTKLLMNEELTILRNSTHHARIIAAAQKEKFATPEPTARSTAQSHNDAVRIANLEDENANLRGLLEQAKSKIQTVKPTSILISTAVASLNQSLNQNFSNECDILKIEVSQKNALISQHLTTISQHTTTISQLTVRISSLEKDIANISTKHAEFKKSSDESAAKDSLDAEILLMRLEHEKAAMEWEMVMSERTIELNSAADARVKSLERKLETEKEEMMDAMALEVDEIEKAKDKERQVLLSEKRELERQVALSINLTKALGSRLSNVSNKSRNLIRFNQELNEKTIKDLNEMRKSMQLVFSHTMIDKLKSVGDELHRSEVRYRKEMLERKKLHNLVQELKGNIRVYMRCRPPTKKEIDNHGSEALCVTFPNVNEVAVFNTEKNREKVWEFDEVFDTSSTQEAVYKDVSDLVVSVLDGYNVCIFAYGQTGSGKTWTMSGPLNNRGVNTRALDELFERTQQRSSMCRDTITVSLLEVYNEEIRDLLVVGGSHEKLEVRQSDGGNHVPGLTVMTVSDLQDVFDLLTLGDSNRSVVRTDMNDNSSRSHMMLTVTVVSENKINGKVSTGKLNLVDLAGSERINKSGATGQALKEAQNINKSLSALGDVIAARASKQAHVPFRNSTLTYLLQDCLSQDSKTLMIVCVSPVLFNVEETFCSLNFAARVRTIELGKASKNVGNKNDGPSKRIK